MGKFLASAVVLGVLVAPLWSDAAFADRRVALVIGNSAYQHAPRLPNPAKDARSMAEMFKQAGFDVISPYNDVGNLDFKRAIRQFENAAAEADMAVVYYAGHGIEIRGTNYLIPIDAKLASDRDADDEAITLNRLVESVEGAKRLRLIIIDACRDNPFTRTMKSRTASVRGISGGLGAVEPTGTDTLIAYAAKAGLTAEDGEGENSPFTKALLNNLTVPGLDIRLAFGRIRDEVLKTTGNRQEPFVYGSLGGGNIALVPAPAIPAPPAVDLKQAERDYNLLNECCTDRKRAWEVFLAQHPTGFYSELARARLDKLSAGEGGAPLAPPRSSPTLASLPSQQTPEQRQPTTEERRAWDRIKDKSNIADFRDFIRRYPSSPLTNTAQTRLDALEPAARQREERERAEREAKAAEAARLEEERAARQREERERAERLRKEREEKAAAEAARLQEERAVRLREERERAERLRKEREEKAAQAPAQPTDAEQRAWNRIKDKSDISKVRDFIKQYPSSPLASTAQTRLEALELAAREREERELAEREAKAAEAARKEQERLAAPKPAPVVRQKDKDAKQERVTRQRDRDDDDRSSRRAKPRQEEVRPKQIARPQQPARVRQEVSVSHQPAHRASGGGSMIGVGF